MPRVGFEPTIPLFERAKTVHALDRATNVIGYPQNLAPKIKFTVVLPRAFCLPERIVSIIFVKRQLQWPRGLRPLEHWNRGFESHLRHGCLCAFILCLCCPVCR
jgi:hypothetical protein